MALKLELDYKFHRAEDKVERINNINEFMCFANKLLVGYMGICDFGGDKLEVNGMVHPEYRKKGIFKKLFYLVKDEWIKRGNNSLLLLSDRQSSSGQGFIKSVIAECSHSEYEMYFRKQLIHVTDNKQVLLRKATNNDALIIKRLNSVCFGKELNEEKMVLPEEEEKCGVRIYLAMLDNVVIGKIHLDMYSSIAGIYGFGVLPEYRGKGYGRAILLRAIEILKEDYQLKEIMIQVEVKNANALNLYLSCGFEIASTMDYYELK